MLAFVASSALTSWAHAESTTSLTAEALFVEGVELMKAGRCPEAIEKFEESSRLEDASGTLLNLANCQVKLRRTASAWLSYRRAIALAAQQAKPEHEALAREREAELKAQLAYLTISVADSDARPLSILVDGVPLARPLWSVPMPIDPGPHRLEARVGNQLLWQNQLEIRAATRTAVAIPLDQKPAGGAPPAAAATPNREPEENVQPKAQPSAGAGAQRIWGYAVGGTGAALFAVGVGVFVDARLKYDRVAGSCPDNACAEGAYETRLSATREWKVGAALAGGGVALLGAGAVLLLTNRAAAADSANSGPVVGSAGAPWSLGWRAKW